MYTDIAPQTTVLKKKSRTWDFMGKLLLFYPDMISA